MREFWSAQCQKLGAPMQDFTKADLTKSTLGFIISFGDYKGRDEVPFKDKSRNYPYNKKSVEKIYICSTTIRFRKDDQKFYDRLMAESEKLGITIAEYMRRATREKLGLPPREPND